MANPTPKAAALQDFLETEFGRTTAITGDVCIPAPIGCGQPAVTFRDELSQKEYRISGLCQACQDSIFGVEDE